MVTTTKASPEPAVAESGKALLPLRRTLPEAPCIVEVDEYGNEYDRGFNGDMSTSPLFVKDGYMMLLASAIDPAMVVSQNEDLRARKYVSANSLENLWRLLEREEIPAHIIGTTCDGWEGVAFVRDTQKRVMVLDAYKLAFALRAVRPDELRVPAAYIEGSVGNAIQSSLSLWRRGILVGVLMPLDVGAAAFSQYDLAGEPVRLAALNGAA